MALAKNNLLVQLSKWASRQDENFQTEAFAHLLRHLLAHEPACAVRLLNKLTKRRLSFATKEAALVQVDCHVGDSSNRPDIEICSAQHLVYVEAKVEAAVSKGQLPSYRALLLASGKQSTALVVLTKYWPEIPAGEEDSSDILVRWFQVADYLRELTCANEASKFLVTQFVDYLRARKMTMEHVGKSLEPGLGALWNFLTMVQEIASREGWKPHAMLASDSIGINLLGRSCWVGLTPEADANYLDFVTKSPIVVASKTRLGEIVPRAPWANNGPSWCNRVNLQSVHFYDLGKEQQFHWLEKFLMTSVNAASRMLASKRGAMPEPTLFDGWNRRK